MTSHIQMDLKCLGGRKSSNSVAGIGHHVLGLQARDTGVKMWTGLLTGHGSHCREILKAKFQAGIKGL